MQAFFFSRLIYNLLFYISILLSSRRNRIQPQRPGDHAKLQTDIRTAHTTGYPRSGTRVLSHNRQTLAARSPTHPFTAIRYKPRSALRTCTLRLRHTHPQQTLARKRQIRLCDQATVSRDNACQRKPCGRFCYRCTGRKTPSAGRSPVSGAWGSTTRLQVIATGR
jgi:hypothetical protein